LHGVKVEVLQPKLAIFNEELFQQTLAKMGCLHPVRNPQQLPSCLLGAHSQTGMDRLCLAAPNMKQHAAALGNARC
jgi:hypothetical protein